jgi:hypothetical protein
MVDDRYGNRAADDYQDADHDVHCFGQSAWL